jgi:hypothetical protein
MYGATAGIFVVGERLIIHGATLAGGMNNLQDTAGVIAGMALANLLLNGNITQDQLCTQLHSNQQAYINDVINGLNSDDPVLPLLRQLSGNNLADMGIPYANKCTPCPSPAPALGHANFAWITSLEDVASGDMKQTWAGLPINWPPGY